MGPQVLLIPALFVAICATFILLHSCYHRWKVGAILKKKRDAAKISLVNILQMTNASLITPAWSSNGAVNSKIRPTLFVTDEDDGRSTSEEKSRNGKTAARFDPRNPNVLSSVLTLSDQQHLPLPPPCYEDLYGPEGSVFTFKSLTPEQEEPPPFSVTKELRKEGGGGCGDATTNAPISNTKFTPNSVLLTADSGSNNPCPLQITPQHFSEELKSMPQERRNSSAVLYL